ncbi:MAG: glycosyltransferase family 1 protein [Halioglobus sp.]
MRCPPRIAVDARPLGRPGTGIYRYTCELLSRMTELGGEWFLYSPQAYDTKNFDSPNVHHRQMRLPSLPGMGQLGQLIYPKWLREDDIDVFWSPRHHLPPGLPRSIRAVVSIHDLVWVSHPETMPALSRLGESLQMPHALKRADRVVALSDFTADELLKKYPALASRLSTVSPASYLPVITTLADKPQPKELAPFLFVGTLEPRKNLDRLFAAYRLYVDAVAAPRRLQIVGGAGWGGVRPQSLITRHGLSGQVEIHGKVDEHTLYQLYRAAHCLVLPSLYEGFGLPIVEALSQGVPVITSMDSAMSEAAGAAGLLVDPNSEVSIATALQNISEDQHVHKALEALTLAQCMRYDWQQSSERLYGLLTSAE